MNEIRVNIVQRTIRVNIQGGTDWNGISGKPPEFPAAPHTHTEYIEKSLATSENDFLVASGIGAWVKKTLAEVKLILGLGSAAYTESSIYAAAYHSHTDKVDKVIGSSLVADTEIAKIHTAGSDAETAQSIMALGIDEIEFAIINSYRI
jgi:hypothetical protein